MSNVGAAAYPAYAGQAQDRRSEARGTHMGPVLGRLILFVATALAVTAAVLPTAAPASSRDARGNPRSAASASATKAGMATAAVAAPSSSGDAHENDRSAASALATKAAIATPAVAAPSSSDAHGNARSAASAFAAPRVPPCEDRAFNLLRGHWSQPVHWKFNAESTPGRLNVDRVEDVVRRSFGNITGARNNCGRADNVDARNKYEGRTTRSANVSRFAFCTRRDGRNVVSFGRLPRWILAVTCTRRVDNRIVEADIRINSRYDWALSTANCSNQELLEPTVTHEVGHVYGLGHVGERRHPRLTMSTRSDGPCSNAATTLGLGDMLGLEQKY